MAKTILYEIKLTLTHEERDKVIDKLGLVFEHSYTDNDKYIQTERGYPREKIKYVDDRVKHYSIQQKDGVFKIEGEEISKEQELELLARGVTSEKQRKKDIYRWPGRTVEVSFDYITDAGPRVFLEVYGRSKHDVIEAKEEMKGMGVTGTIELTYDDLLK